MVERVCKICGGELADDEGVEWEGGWAHHTCARAEEDRYEWQADHDDD